MLLDMLLSFLLFIKNSCVYREECTCCPIPSKPMAHHCLPSKRLFHHPSNLRKAFLTLSCTMEETKFSFDTPPWRLPEVALLAGYPLLRGNVFFYTFGISLQTSVSLGG